MQHKRKARPSRQGKRASVSKDNISIPRADWERGCWGFALPVLVGWCAIILIELIA